MTEQHPKAVETVSGISCRATGFLTIKAPDPLLDKLDGLIQEEILVAAKECENDFPSVLLNLENIYLANLPDGLTSEMASKLHEYDERFGTAVELAVGKAAAKLLTSDEGELEVVAKTGTGYDMGMSVAKKEIEEDVNLYTCITFHNLREAMAEAIHEALAK